MQLSTAEDALQLDGQRGSLRLGGATKRSFSRWQWAQSPSKKVYSSISLTLLRAESVFISGTKRAGAGMFVNSLTACELEQIWGKGC